MATEISMTGEQLRSLRQHAFSGDVEQAAVIFAEVRENSKDLVFAYRVIEYLGPDDFEIQSAFHIELTDACRGRLIKTAWDERLAMIEVHSHVGKFASAAFSPTDLDGLREFVPHVRWRLRGIPYAAVVMAGDEFDGLVWSADDHTAAALDAITVDNSRHLATGCTLRAIRS